MAFLLFSLLADIFPRLPVQFFPVWTPVPPATSLLKMCSVPLHAQHRRGLWPGSARIPTSPQTFASLVSHIRSCCFLWCMSSRHCFFFCTQIYAWQNIALRECSWLQFGLRKRKKMPHNMVSSVHRDLAAVVQLQSLTSAVCYFSI